MRHSHHWQPQPVKWCRFQTDQSQSSLYWKHWPEKQKNKKHILVFFNISKYTKHCHSPTLNQSSPDVYITNWHSHQRGQQLPWQRPGPVCWWRMSPSWHTDQLPLHAAGHWRPEPRWCLPPPTDSPPQNGPNCWCWPDGSHLEAGRRTDSETDRVFSWVRRIKVVVKPPVVRDQHTEFSVWWLSSPPRYWALAPVVPDPLRMLRNCSPTCFSTVWSTPEWNAANLMAQ